MSMPLRKSHPIFSIMNNAVVDLPAPSNLSIWWNFGSLLGLCLGVQIVTGLFLSMHYAPNVGLAFSSVAHIVRDVDYGWMMRNIHANGGSWFFICLYLHVGRGIYYGSYMYVEVWNIGVVIFLLTMGTAFVGYVLPWGQMSFWGATVITNLASAIPYIGKAIVEWVWGGFAVDNATLNRFFAFHFILPFIVAAMVIVHLLFLHQTGSNNMLGLNANVDKVPFDDYYTSKDLVGFVVVLLMLVCMSMFIPNLLGDPENFIPASSLVTPIHIAPEWYFLFAYAILRSIPNKLGGVVAMFAAILVLFILPFSVSSVRWGVVYYPISQFLFWSFICVFLLLTWIGGRPVESPYEGLGQIFTVLYFIYYLVSPLLIEVWNKLI